MIMKRWLFLILAMVLLSGCAAEPEATVPMTVPAETQAPPAVDPVGYYDPDSALEQSSGGALRVYPLNRSDSYELVNMGSDLLLLSGDEVTTLTKLTGASLYVDAAANLGCYIDAQSPAFLALDKGVTYYDQLHRELVFLDAELKEVNRVSLPDDILGDPAISSDRKNLYYLTASHLRAIDLETGLDKLIRETSLPGQTLSSLYCSDTVLEYLVPDNNGNCSSLFVSVKTGETILEFRDELTLCTQGGSYFAVHTDGQYQEFLVGTAGQEPALLLSDTYGMLAEAVLEMNGAVLHHTENDTTNLYFYDLESGICTSSVAIPGERYLRSIRGSIEESCIWFLCYDPTCSSDILCRWDLEKTALTDQAGGFVPRYTAQNPDTAGLAACQNKADAISETYDVEVWIWTDALDCQPETYALEPEYQTTVLARSLDILEQALAGYPAGFLKKAASGTESGRIRICLVRSLTATAANVPQDAGGTQFWDKDGNACVIVAVGDELTYNLYHQVFHVIDSYVLSRCSDYDIWDTLNPKGFSYTYSYSAQIEDPSAFFESSDWAFIDLFSMTFPREDRATVMKYAMTEGNEHYFASESMQRKLKTLCHGIRDAFRLKKSPESFLWEQYLAE